MPASMATPLAKGGTGNAEMDPNVLIGTGNGFLTATASRVVAPAIWC